MTGLLAGTLFVQQKNITRKIATMLMPDDEDCVLAMVGPHGLATLPNGFMDEYLVRAKMMSRGGRPGPLGLPLMMQLLRDCNVFPVDAPKPVAIKSSDAIEPNTRIVFNGQGGIYCSNASPTTSLIRLDGRRAQEEAPTVDIKFEPSMVAGIPDSFFVREPDPIMANMTKEIRQPTEEIQNLLNTWGMVEAGTPVWIKAGDDWIPAEFIDLNSDKGSLAVALNGRRTVVDPSDVSITAPEMAASE